MPCPPAIVRPRPALTLLAACALAVGCASTDEHEFHSTPHLPTTVTLYDSMNARPLWVKEVPVQHKLLVDFDRGEDNEALKLNTNPPTHMQWWLYDEDGNKDKAIQTEKMTLPGVPVILKVAYRKSPEYPPGQKTPVDEANRLFNENTGQTPLVEDEGEPAKP